MGAHHFTLYLVPPGSRPVRDAGGDYEGDFLLGFGLAAKVVQRLRALLPNPNPWGGVEEFNSASQWGSDLRIFHEDDGRVAEIVMRYAPVGDPIQVLREFVEVAKEAGCEVLVETSGEVIPPEFENVLPALHNHRAFRFLHDPESAIKQAADETNQNC